MKPVFLLIPGFGSSQLWWEYEYDIKTESINHVDFLDNLKKIGYVYKITFPWFNIDYYFKNPDKKIANKWKKIHEKYKPHTSNIDFTLDDLDYNNICKKLYNNLREKYPKNKIIPIGHSYGGPIAHVFSKLYPKDCQFCIILDGSPLGKTLQQNFYEKYEKKNEKMIKKTFPNNDALQKILHKIKTEENTNKEQQKIYKLVSFKSTVWKMNNLSLSDNIKLSIPTYFFRSYHTDYTKNIGINPYKKMWNIWSKEEPKNVPEGKYIFYIDAPHYLWYDKKCSDDIINHIKCFI